MLGLLHKIVLGKAAPQYSEFVFLERPRNEPRGWRARDRRHSKQLHDPIDGTQSRAVQRSLLGMIYVYNMLPESTVASMSVSAFQRKLQNCIKRLAESKLPSWSSFLDDGVRKTSCSSFQDCFTTQGQERPMKMKLPKAKLLGAWGGGRVGFGRSSV